MVRYWSDFVPDRFGVRHLYAMACYIRLLTLGQPFRLISMPYFNPMTSLGNPVSLRFKNVFIRSFHLYNCKIIEKTPNTTCCLMRPWAHAPLQAVLIVSVIRYFSFYIHSTVDLLVHEPVHRAHVPRYHLSRNTNISSYYTTCHLAHILGFYETSWKALYEIAVSSAIYILYI